MFWGLLDGPRSTKEGAGEARKVTGVLDDVVIVTETPDIHLLTVHKLPLLSRYLRSNDNFQKSKSL